MQIELAYLGVEVNDVDGLAAVLGGVAGLIPGEAHDGVATWRNDDRAQRILVTEGPADDATVIGFEVPSSDAAAAVADRLTSLGYEVAEAGAADCVSRRVDGMWKTVSPWGTPVEIVHGLALSNPGESFGSELVRGGFKTDGVGFGHCVFMVADAEAADRFVVEGLGMRQTDWIELHHCSRRGSCGPLLPLQSATPHAGADRSAGTAAREDDASRDVRDRRARRCRSCVRPGLRRRSPDP